jgi:hypothetical protein
VNSDIEIRERLNLREGMEIRECGSFDEAVSWCYRHDFGPLGWWPQEFADPDFDVKLGFAQPHLEDYLRLLLKEPESFDIPAYARTLFERMIAETEKIDRYPDGDLIMESIVAYNSRFRSVDFDRSAREREISIYPFRAFEIDIEPIYNELLGLRDPRTQYLANLVRFYFPTICEMAARTKYSSYDDKIYLMHVNSIGRPVEDLVFSNPAVRKDPRPFSYIWNWASWAGMQLRPRIEGENF